MAQSAIQSETVSYRRPWTIHRNARGWPRWYQPLYEAWIVLSGRCSLHRAWQHGYDQHIMDESARRARTDGYNDACVVASPIYWNALSSIANNTCCNGCQEAARVAKAALERTDRIFRSRSQQIAKAST